MTRPLSPAGLFAAVALWAGSLLSGPAAAEDPAKWPSRPIEIVVQNAPGGASDVFARMLARAAEPIFGQPVVVVNKAGGGGATQMAAVKAARPDGYTIGVNTLSHFTAMLTNLKGTFKPADFSWIALLQNDAHVLFVRADSPDKDFASLVARVKANGGTITTGGYGAVGSIANIATQLVSDSAGIGVNWVGYNGSPEAIAGLLGGHVELGVANPGPVMEFARSGRVRILGILATERSPVLPDVATFSELGYAADGNWQQIRGIYGPAGIPAEIQQKIADGLIRASQTPEFAKYQADVGIVGAALGPQDYAARVQVLLGLAENGLTASGLVQASR